MKSDYGDSPIHDPQMFSYSENEILRHHIKIAFQAVPAEPGDEDTREPHRVLSWESRPHPHQLQQSGELVLALVAWLQVSWPSSHKSRRASLAP